jgi:signal transduction histidine kinase
MYRFTSRQLFFIISIFIPIATFSSNSKIDSLKHLLKNANNDTSKVILYDKIINEIYSENIDTALFYAQNALKLSEYINWNEGKVITCNKLSMCFINRSLPDSAMLYVNLAISFNDSHKFKKELSESFMFKADIFKDIQQFDSMFLYYDLAMNVANEYSFNENVAKVFNSLANYYEQTAQFELALNSYLKALEIFEKTNNRKSIAITNSNIAGIYLRQEQFDEAINLYQKALETNLELNNNIELASNYNNLGIIYKYKNEIPKAILYYNKAIEINEMIGNLNSIVKIKYNLGIIARNQGDYNKAIQLFNESLMISEKANIIIGFAYNYLGLAITFSEFNQINRAINYFEKALKYSIDLRLTTLELEIYNNLFELFEKSENYKEAFYYQSKFHELTDSIYNIQNTKQLSELQTKYQTEQKEKENLILKAKNETQKYRIHLQYIIIVSIVILFILFFVLFIIFRRRKQKSEELYERLKFKNDKITHQREQHEETIRDLKRTEHFKSDLIDMIAHDLKNPLSSLMSVSEKIENDWVKKLVDTSSQQMLNMITNMLDVQKFDDVSMKLHLSNYNLDAIVEEAKYTLSYIIDQKRIFFEKEIDENIWVLTEKDILVRIFVNLLSNSLKYTSVNGYVGVKASIENEIVNIKVYDTGLGIPADQIDSIFNKYNQVDSRKSGLARSSGLGLTFCKYAIEAHGFDIRAVSMKDVGTSFIFKLQKAEEGKGELGKVSSPLNISSDVDFDRYRLQLEDLIDYNVYEISSIKKVLKELEVHDDPLLKDWIAKMEQAIFTGNEKLYKDLINQI